jgi:hypothetical protein
VRLADEYENSREILKDKLNEDLKWNLVKN